MKNNSATSNIELNLSSSSWTDWLVTHRKTASIALACLVLCVAGLVWALQKQKARQIKDFETADVLAEEIEKSPALFDNDQSADANKALAELRTITDKYSVLQNRFDSLIAQEEMLVNNPNLIDPYAKRAVASMKNIGLSDYAAFSEVSRLASLHKYKEALAAAGSLRNRLKENAAKNSEGQFLLEGFLLLHIASLNQKLGNIENAQGAMVELKEFLGLVSSPRELTLREKELSGSLLSHLQEKQNSLLTFLEQQKKPENQ